MEQALVSRNKRRVRKLEGVIEDALHARKPTKIGLVAHHDSVVATLGHQGTDTLDTTGRTGSKLRHADSFLVVSIKTGRAQSTYGIACDPQPIGNPPLNMIRKTMEVNKS